MKSKNQKRSILEIHKRNTIIQLHKNNEIII